MIRREIEPHRHVRPEGGDGLQLEGGKLEGNRSRGVVIEHHIREGAAVVSTGFATHAARGEDPLHQLGGGGLAVGTGDSHHPAPVNARGKLDFPDGLPRPVAKGGGKLPAGLDPGADHDQIRTAGAPRFRGRSGTQFGFGGHRSESVQPGRVVNRDRGTPAQRQMRGGPATSASPQDRNLFSGEIH